MDTQIMDWREDALNNLLYGAWEEYAKALGTGEVLELEESYEMWVARALNEAVPANARTVTA